MKKRIVTRTGEYSYNTRESTLGHLKPKTHPYVRSSVFVCDHHLKKGDILRCDGFPFMSRPKPLYTNKPIKYNEGVSIRFEEVMTHKPVQLPTSLWVLRPVENIDESTRSNRKSKSRV